ncbi:MAG: hypothetical protein DHS20C11_25440 [Lysobacteraceae bacterium]|nr:MAG: hypothetical protein DHS20C11_25440 [Xanthomonadaceae bacterium]
MAMKVFEWHQNTTEYAAFAPKAYSDHEKALLFASGQDVVGSISFRKIGDAASVSDNPMCGVPGAVLVSNRALQSLPQLSSVGCSVEVDLQGELVERPFWLVRINKVADCLDHARGRIDGLKDVYFFLGSAVPNNCPFKLPEHLARVFADGDFVEDVAANHLAGFEFSLLWDSDKGGKQMVLAGQHAELQWVR